MSAEPSPDRQEIVDGEQLRILAICYYVLGGIAIFFATFAIIYVVFGLVIASDPDFLHNPQRPDNPRPPAAMGFVIAAMGGVCLCLGWVVGGLQIFAGRALQKRQHRTFTLVLAAISCLWVPFGTLLGVFTLIVLLRPSVIRLYEQQP